MNSSEEQRFEYAVEQGRQFVELIREDTSDIGEAFRNMCRWAQIVYDKAAAEGIAPLYVATSIVQALNGALMQLILDPPKTGGEDPREESK